MSTDPKHILPEASKEAVHAARDAAQAVELAREVQTNRVAGAVASKVTEDIGDILQERIEHVLARGTEQDKSIVLARVPYICQDIKGINKSLNDIIRMIEKNRSDREERDDKIAIANEKRYVNQDQFGPFKWTLTIIAGAVITGLVGAFMALVIIK